jgi:uncharacterized OB-fold protein
MPRFAVRSDAASAAFLEGAARGELLIVQDTQTGAFHEPQFDIAQDPARFRYVPAAGTGKVISWSVVHEKNAQGGTDRRPVAIVELSEGPWWWAELVGVDPDADLFELPVLVDFERFGDGTAIPYFRPAA